MATTINLSVPARQVPKGMVYNAELAEKRRAKFKVIRLNPDGKGAGGRLYSGAPRTWAKNPSELYSWNYGLSGTRAHITEALTMLGYSATDINNVLADAMDYNDYKNEGGAKRQAFDAIIAQYEVFKETGGGKKARKTSSNYTLEHLLFSIAKDAQPMGAEVRVRATSPRGSRSLSLAEKIADLDAEHVYNVTGFATTGKVKKALRTKTTRGKNFTFGNLPISSESLHDYEAAVRAIPGGESKYASALAQARAHFQQAAAHLAGAGTLRPASPQAGLAVRPTFTTVATGGKITPLRPFARA